MWKLKVVKKVLLIISVEGITTRILIQSMKILNLLDGLAITMYRETILLIHFKRSI